MPLDRISPSITTVRTTPFHVLLIKPTHYADDGYPIRWMRSLIPSNSLASVYGLVADVADRQALGPEVDILITAMDETNAIFDPAREIRRLRRAGGRAVLFLVGVQSNQYPRAMDLAEPFIAAGIPVCVGGFHVSGCLSMLDETPPEIAAAIERGISMFAGEGEAGRIERVLRDAYSGTLKPIYNYLKDQPNLVGEPVPILPRDHIRRCYGNTTSFDLGRGCPFQCSFCTIINVQGRVSRFRDPDDLEKIVRANIAQGIHRFFITDDNLARNRQWEDAFDRLIKLREDEGIKVQLNIQVDTLCHRIPGFVDKACKAGAEQIFFGLESVNAENLIAVKKKQNRIEEYKELFHAWKRYPVVITIGYILGFPGDTPESIRADIDLIKREFPVDLIYFTNLTPLPGSEDHVNALRRGEWMDPDLNKYDLNHRVTHHPVMTDAEWDKAYSDAWEQFYTPEHMVTILRRMFALGSNKKNMTVRYLMAYREFRRQYGMHPLEGGFVPVRRRHERRPGMPREPWGLFHLRYAWDVARVGLNALRTFRFLDREMRRIHRDPARRSYVDAATVRPALAERPRKAAAEIKIPKLKSVPRRDSQVAAE